MTAMGQSHPPMLSDPPLSPVAPTEDDHGTLAVVFPGQGNQAAGIGRQWQAHPAWSIVEAAEEAAGRPLAPLVLDPDADLSRTEDSQLAVLVASLLAWEAARPYLGEPVAFAGHSLGQITALIAAGAVTLANGVHLAHMRAAVTQRCADLNPGGLIALLGASPEQAQAAVADVAEAWVANDNAPGQIVVGGTPEGLAQAGEAARAAGIRKIRPLAVGGAFHTPLMTTAARTFRPVVASTPFVPLTAPVVTNHDAQPHWARTGWDERLATHLVRPVRWRETVDTLADLGARRIVELGPGTTLSALVRRCRGDVETAAASTPEEVDGLLSTLWGVGAR